MVAMTLREFGRMRGVSHQAVRKAISAGRLSKSVSYDRSGRPLIDPDVAEGEWEARTHPVHGGRREPGVPLSPAGPGTAAASTFAQSRALREAYMARLAKLEFEEKTGQLVRADEVRNEAFKTGRLIREAMLNIPDRVAAEIAAEGDPALIHKRLTDEVRHALSSTLADDETRVRRELRLAHGRQNRR